MTARMQTERQLGAEKKELVTKKDQRGNPIDSLTRGGKGGRGVGSRTCRINEVLMKGGGVGKKIGEGADGYRGLVRQFLLVAIRDWLQDHRFRKKEKKKKKTSCTGR